MTFFFRSLRQKNPIPYDLYHEKAQTASEQWSKPFWHFIILVGQWGSLFHGLWNDPYVTRKYFIPYITQPTWGLTTAQVKNTGASKHFSPCGVCETFGRKDEFPNKFNKQRNRNHFEFCIHIHIYIHMSKQNCLYTVYFIFPLHP